MCERKGTMSCVSAQFRYILWLFHVGQVLAACCVARIVG